MRVKSEGMFHFEKSTVFLPDNISVMINDRTIIVKGVRGTLSLCLHHVLCCKMVNKALILNFCSNKRYMNSKALLGTTCSLLRSMFLGVTVGFIKKLQLVGIGYRAAVKEDIMNLSVGFSHVINYKLPNEIHVVCPTPVDIILNGLDKQLVGQVAADLRAIRPPQIFSGKGIRYADEILRIKEVKKK